MTPEPTTLLGVVVDARREPCRWCSKPIVAVDVRGHGAQWTQHDRHPCEPSTPHAPKLNATEAP